MLVGDIVIAMREAITDMPQTLPAPSITSASGATTTGGSVPLGTYYVKLTALNPWGETLPSAESSPFTLSGANNSIQIVYTAPPGYVSVNVYIATTTGAESFYVNVVDQTGTITVLAISGSSVVSSTVPTRSTAYIPDTNGGTFSAATLFRWLNDALKQASQICGGLIDYSGVGSVTGQPMYIIPGQWRSISDVWYDGYPLAPDKRGNFFRKNAITASVLSQVTTSLLTDRMMIEVWPQPARTAATSTLTGAISATATSMSLTSIGGFLLTNGFVQVDSEIMAYNGQSGLTLKNLIRGLSGTTPAAHALGATTQELNLFFGGWRAYAPTFAPGSSAASIPVPVGWETLLPFYGLARARLAELNTQESLTLMKAFTDGIGNWFRTNKVTTGPRQIGDTSNNLEVIPSLGGGWVVP